MSTKVVYSYPLGKKFAFNLNSLITSYIILLFYNYCWKIQSKKTIKDLYKTVEPNQYARNKSMLKEF